MLLLPLLAATPLLLVQAPSNTAPPPPLRFDAPRDWIKQETTSRMRLAEFTLPKAAGDAEDASVVVSFFAGQGGSAEANLERWTSQMTQPDGRASKDLAKVSKQTVGTLQLTNLDLTGTYVAETRPGSSERFNKPGFRVRAAVVEGRGGPYFIKLTGPAATVAKWDASYEAFLKSLRVE